MAVCALAGRWDLGAFLASALVGLLATACNQPPASFVCTQSSECDFGVSGICESNGLCSYVDDECEFGRRFSPNAGAQSSLCITPVDTLLDGGIDANTADSDADIPATGDVDLSPGDDFQAANDANAAGTIFVIKTGTHVRQRVVNPKSGNKWFSEPGATMDGEDAVSEAFSGPATGVEIRGIRISNYIDNGIHFTGGSAVVISGITVYQTGSGSGEDNGALVFDNMTNVTVTESHFERVSAGVLTTDCTGPIAIERNTALNSGWAFAQLKRVSGPGIRVNYNSMERDGSYVRPGNHDVESWISMYAVQGLPGDVAQVNYNRARGHSTSASGSFIVLGNGGGDYQEAVGNYGVTPGQVGIGLSGGQYMQARDNYLFSESWSQSNVAFYSSDYGAGPCSNHTVSGNRSNWLNSGGNQNNLFTSASCAPVTVVGNTFPDALLNASLWDAWPY